MSENLWDALACPHCRGRIERSGAAARCGACGRSFASDNDIPSLLRDGEAASFARFSAEYRRARLNDGWRELTQEQKLALPHDSPPGFQPLYWETRRRSFEALERLLREQGPKPTEGPMVDLGAGFGWLAYRLVKAGYQVLAVEASTDDLFGLGAARTYLEGGYPFLRIQGNLENPPLRDQSVSAIILSASLHYAQDLQETLRRCAVALRPGGRLVIMDSPVSRQPQPGTGKGDRHLGSEELNEALKHAGLDPRWVRVGQGWRWWVHQAKAWVRRRERFDFPLVIAYRR